MPLTDRKVVRVTGVKNGRKTRDCGVKASPGALRDADPKNDLIGLNACRTVRKPSQSRLSKKRKLAKDVRHRVTPSRTAQRSNNSSGSISSGKSGAMHLTTNSSILNPRRRHS